MSLYTLTDPDIFMGCDEPPNGQGQLYLKAWKMQKKDMSNPNIQRFGNLLFTVGNHGDEQQTDYDGLSIFNGEIKGPDLDQLCEDLMQSRLRVNLDGYSYHVVSIQLQMGSTSPAEQVTKLLRLNDLFDWGQYADVVMSGTNFKPGPSQTTWNRRSQANPRTIVVKYEQLDKDLEEPQGKLKDKQNELDALQRRFDKDSEELRGKLKGKQSELDALQLKFDDLQHNYDNYC